MKTNAYTGLTKEGKQYQPTLFSEIYEFHMRAPILLVKEFDELIEGEKFTEAIEILEEFLEIEIPEKTKRQLTYADEKGFLPRELPYLLPKKEKGKAKKYWKHTKSEPVKHIGVDANDDYKILLEDDEYDMEGISYSLEYAVKQVILDEFGADFDGSILITVKAKE